MRLALPLLALFVLLVGCGKEEEATPSPSPAQEVKVETPSDTPEREPETPTIDSALIAKVDELNQLAQKLEALIPLPETACFAIGLLESEVYGLRLSKNSLAGNGQAAEFFERFDRQQRPNYNYDCAGVDLDQEIKWRESYIPGVYGYLGLVKEGAEKGFLLGRAPARDSMSLQSKLYTVFLRWVQINKSADDVTRFGADPTEGSVGKFQHKLVSSLYDLDEVLAAREAELGELGLQPQLGEVKRAIEGFSSPAAKGVAGFEQTKEQLKKLVVALKALRCVLKK